ncbi:MAG: sporulation protein YqfD, partial [Clostridia bacterium]|nr:sporulation protein YqfD [Clostridia bacterium]
YRRGQVKRALLGEGAEFSFGRIRGLPALIYRYRRRIGIPIGAILGALIIWLSGQVIWCINIEGNRNVSDEEIICVLDSLGCGIGDRYGNIDFDSLHNRFLLSCPDISWIAVNMNGTHANVEVKETVRESVDEDGGFYNIVAAEDGHIESIENVEGKTVVEIYDTVEKGDLLISGAISYKAQTMNRFESAEGKVFARVRRNFEVRVPYETEKKVYTGEEKQENRVRFFDFHINLFRNSRIPDGLCDKITMNSQIYLLDSLPLPLYIDKTVYRQYELVGETLSKKEALDRAMAAYREKLCETLGEASLLSRSVTVEDDSEGVTVRCELLCLADIAKKAPLVIERAETE